MSHSPAVGHCFLLKILLLLFSPEGICGLTNLVGLIPPRSEEKGYVSSKACQECHQEEYKSWHATFHRTMTQPAGPESIKAPFDGRIIDSAGLSYKVYKQGDEFWAEMPDPDYMMLVVQGNRQIPLDKIPRVQRRVLLVTGSHHYQTFWVGSSRFDKLMQTLPLVYLLEDKRWVPREAAFMRAPTDDQRFVTQWNHHCIRCHSTGGNPGLNEKTGRLETRVGEYGIACEACHGPGRAHVELRRAAADISDATQLAQFLANDPIVNPKRLSPQRSAEVCGQCHGSYIMKDEFAMIYAREGTTYKPGEDLHATRYYIQHPTPDSPADRWEDLKRNPEFFRERWWDDGTVLAGGREYTALSASACFTKGNISCLSCHSMHRSDPNDQLKAFRSESDQCVQCHKEPKYTTAVRSHTFHPPESSGSNCLNCHMPHTTYALLKGIRSHQINSPQLASSSKYGVPNACNLCHLDRTLEWTQTHLTQWYGTKEVPLSPEQKTNAASILWLVKGHAAQRVITAWHYGWAPAQEISGQDWMPPMLAPLLQDNYGVVRYVAARSLKTLPGFENFDFDFLAGRAELRRKASLALKGLKPPVVQKPELLITEEGALDYQRLARFLAERDQRPVSIKE